MKLELKTTIIFNTIEELQEAVDLGLQDKQLYLGQRYRLPMIQGIKHSKHNALSGYQKVDEEDKKLFEDQRFWCDVREEYITKKWEPTGINNRYRITSDGEVYDTNITSNRDKTFGMLYNTKEQAEKARDAMRIHNRLLAYVAEFDNGWEANWEDRSQDKAFIAYDHEDEKYSSYHNKSNEYLGTVYMSEECAEELVKKLNSGEVVL